MHRTSLVTLCSIVTLAAALSTSPAMAQGKGKEKKEKKETRVEQRAGDRYENDRYDDRFRRDRSRADDDYNRRSSSRGNGSGKVPPGWCKGKGNPHNTPENCGYGNARGRTDDRYDRDGRRTSGRAGRYGSYDEAHVDFHRYLDRKYSDLADDRPLDPAYQIRIRRERKAEHDRWHAERGRAH